MAIKTTLLNNAKNIRGWRTKRKLVAFSVDDYGNVRLDSKEARRRMDKEGLKVYNRFDAYDTLETKEDLEILFEALSSVKDKNGHHAVFTPFAMPANLNFERIAESLFTKFEYELLPETFSKLPGYEGTWELLKEGIDKKFIVPQFHGREHLNLKVFEEALERKDPVTLTALKNRSYTSIGPSPYKTISVTAAFEFWEIEENERFAEIIKDGLQAFEKVYGYPSPHFNPPGGREHPRIHKALHEAGVKYIDTPLVKQEHQGKGVYKRVINYTGKRNDLGQIFMVRNCVFEPTEKMPFNWVDYCLKQVEAAFRWNRPAVISSHRVNFCGHIDPENRRKGIEALQQLLAEISKRWPDVEFVSATDICDMIDR